MKKLVFLFTLVIATVIIYGAANQNNPKDSKGTNKNNVAESKPYRDSIKSTETTLNSQKVTFLLYKGTVRADWSPSFWWNPQPANTGKPGC